MGIGIRSKGKVKGLNENGFRELSMWERSGKHHKAQNKGKCL